ncbi:TetR/AcrR family transcriptional regulator [Deinococcus sp.]|uniref:TetR/AcrR family transcriptional regulator n=1 Tax=Deinococcus sp. TaxID=47478 RepID=UPI003C7C6C80
MPYPAKTNAEQILAAAVPMLEQVGQAGLSLRALAAELKLTPNALYRYFPSREALLAAVAVQAAEWLLTDLQGATGDDPAELARRYLHFARTRPALYDLYMTCDSLNAEQLRVYGQLWELVVARLLPLAGPFSPQAAMTLWGYLHGMVGLERSGVYDDPSHDKPRGTTTFGLEVLVAGLRSLNPVICP